MPTTWDDAGTFIHVVAAQVSKQDDRFYVSMSHIAHARVSMEPFAVSPVDSLLASRCLPVYKLSTTHLL